MPAIPYPGMVVRMNSEGSWECMMTNNSRVLTFAETEADGQAGCVQAFAAAMREGGSRATFAASEVFVDADAAEVVNAFLQAGRGFYFGLDLLYTVVRIDLFDECAAAGDLFLAALAA